jgi:hypothetical protein
MAISAVPFALQNVPINADVVREAVSSLVINGGGVVQFGDFPVAQTGTPSMAVTVGVGRAWIPGTNVSNLSGTSYSKQGMYFVLNDAAVTLTIATANATNPRIDVVYAVIRDQAYSGSNNDAQLAVATGTPAASPTVPSIPSNAISLAQVAVAANATSIVNANISVPADALTKHAEWTTSGNGLATSIVYNPGVATSVAGSTTDHDFYTFAANFGIQPAQSGVYTVTVTQKWSAAIASGTRAFLQLTSGALGAGTQYTRNSWGAAEDTCTTSATVYIPAGSAIYPSIYQAAGTLNVSGLVTITKVG